MYVPVPSVPLFAAGVITYYEVKVHRADGSSAKESAVSTCHKTESDLIKLSGRKLEASEAEEKSKQSGG